MSNSTHIRIGTSLKNDVVIKNEHVDLNHLELFSDDSGHVFITDLASENGTFVNGKKLKGYTLLDSGDQVFLGKSYQLNWEVYKSISPKKEVVKQSTQTVRPKVNSQTSTPTLNAVLFNGINKQLILIYGLIIFVLILIAVVF